MNTSNYLLHLSCFSEPTYDSLCSSTLEFYSLSGLLSFYRFLLNDGFVYEYWDKRFVKSENGVFSIVMFI